MQLCAAAPNGLRKVLYLLAFIYVCSMKKTTRECKACPVDVEKTPGIAISVTNVKPVLKGSSIGSSYKSSICAF